MHMIRRMSQTMFSPMSWAKDFTRLMTESHRYSVDRSNAQMNVCTEEFQLLLTIVLCLC